ncbi:DUF5134 domain-containing protein [Streptomyces cinnamoneus]|uniref:DUF5134 domain-containing protein n=1 Tax=Streptomyces cinnamoneus TaxID=53446 RepID=UPI0037B64F1A
MHGPPLAGWLLMALSAAVGTYCLWGTRAGAAGERRAAGGDALMGLGMAVMAVPAPALDIRPWGPAALAVVFGVAALRSLGRARRHPGARAPGGEGVSSPHLHHAVGAFAMVYMSLAMAGSPAPPAPVHGGHAAAGHQPAGAPLLTGLLLLYFAVYVLRSVRGLVPVPAVAAGGPGRPAVTNACRLSMGIGMLAMLVTM